MSGANPPDPRIQPIWVTSQDELEHFLVELGRERGLDEAAVRQRIPAIMRVLWRHARLWRLVFKGSRFWLDRRGGDGRLLGDSDSGFGALGDFIRTNWTVSLNWVRRRYRDGRLADPYEFAHCYLGLHLEYDGDLQKLPRSASLELMFDGIELALTAVLNEEQQSQPSLQMNLHLHTTAPNESEKPATPKSSDQIFDLDAILPTGTAGRPTLRVHILLEMYRRAARNELADGVGEQARQLRQWVIDTYPKAAPPTAESIENAIRQEYQQRNQKPTK